MKHHFIGLFCSILLCLVVACKPKNESPSPSSSNAVAHTEQATILGKADNNNAILQIDSLLFNKQYGNCQQEEPCVSIQVKTLLATAGTNAQALQNINQALHNAAATYMIEGNEAVANRTMEQLAELVRQTFEKEGKQYGMSWQYDIESYLRMNENQILSVEVASNTYTGGAHPNFANSLMSFDTQTGNRLSLSDLLVPTYQPRLSQIIAQQLRQQFDIPAAVPLTQHGFITDHVAPNDNYMLTPKNIVFHYNAYEIAPYVMGHIVVEVPYDQISDLIAPNSKINALSH